MLINLQSTVNRAKDILFSQLDDEMLAIDAQSGYCYSMNESAWRVWSILAEPATVSAVCAQLRKEFAVPPDVCERDVLRLLQDLHNAGLVNIKE